jgi:ubiquinone/menaquinone biosynthesis C-methylase UbiE
MASGAKNVNYDQTAGDYDTRYRANRLTGVERALLDQIRSINASRVLEVGCGTGRWLASISSVARDTFGLDLSSQMMAQAQKAQKKLHLVRGRAGRLPFKVQSFDLIFCVNALHHFDDPLGFITKAWKLLKPGGYLSIIGQVPQDRRNHWYIYDYFDGTFETDLKRFHTWETVSEWMDGVGYNNIQWSQVETIIDHKYGRGVFQDPFLKKESVSQLALLSDQAYNRGIQRIWEAIEAADTVGDNLIFQTELRLDMLTGNRNLTAP